MIKSKQTLHPSGREGCVKIISKEDCNFKVGNIVNIDGKDCEILNAQYPKTFMIGEPKEMWVLVKEI